LISETETTDYYPDGIKKSHNFINEEMCDNDGGTDYNKVNYMITVLDIQILSYLKNFFSEKSVRVFKLPLELYAICVPTL